MDRNYDYDLLVIGSGPGGYVAAIRASQLGLKTAVIEKDKPGGVCLNIGCIPSKALIHQAGIYSDRKSLMDMGIKIDESGFDYSTVFKKSRKAADMLGRGVQFLLKKNNVELIMGNGTIMSANRVKVGNDKEYTAKYIMVATGSSPREIPGFTIDEDKVLSSTGALMLDKLPKDILILGAGAIGMEFAYVLNAFGVEVHVVEMMDSILPLEDKEMSDVVNKAFKKQGVKLYTGTKALSMAEQGNERILVTMEDAKGKQFTQEVEKVLVAVGRAPNTRGIGLENVGIETDRGFVPVGDYYKTKTPNIFAIGDIVNSPLLAHVASKEGEIAVEHMAGLNPEPKVDSSAIPSAVYCEPQIASFGLTEEKAKETGVDYKAATFPYRGVGKAVAIENADGMVKIVYDPSTNEILGGHIVGAEATELIHELLLAKTAELLPVDIVSMIHAHPTLSEGVLEAARTVEGNAIHF
ncbi:MAG: dihydrolipoyl dehydrogenase [Clostridiales bacterium]|nr:dihydrolipoyl dehydrogenase [Clostridiales bacterium]